MLRKWLHLWPLGLLCFDAKTSLSILALEMSEIQKLVDSGCPSPLLIPFLARQKWCPCSINETTYQRKFCECPCEPCEDRADTCIFVAKIYLPRSLSCMSTIAMCVSLCACNTFHHCLFTMLSTLFLLTFFVKSKCLNLDQATKAMSWFLQVCKTQNFSPSWWWPVQQRQNSDTFQVQALLLFVSKTH